MELQQGVTKICPFNIMLLRKFLYGITTRSTKNLFLNKNINSKIIKISILPKI